MKKLKFNKAALLQAKQQILQSPKHFQMGWVQTSSIIDTSIDLPRAKCGTMFCIAGRICSNAGYERGGILRAAKLLGLPEGPPSLFMVPLWPDPFNAAWHKCKTLKGRARIAANRIDHFIRKVEGRIFKKP
jgi:hypothetical protein